MYSLIHKHKRLVALLVGLASFSFFLWLFFQGGVKEFFSSSSCVAKVNSECISIRDYRRELMRYSRFLEDKNLEQSVKKTVLESLIVQELLYQKAKEQGLLASPMEVKEVISSDPSFQENGTFNLQKYKDTLLKVGMEPYEYEEYIKRLLSIQKLLRLISNAVYMTPVEEEINIKVHSTLLSGRLYLITPQTVRIDYKPSEEEILNYYKQHQEEFKSEPTKVIRVWRVKDKKVAQSIYEDLKSGKEVQGFEELQLPKDSQRLSQNLLGEVQKLSQKGQFTFTREGEDYVIIKLEDVKEGTQDFQEVKQKVAERLFQEKLKDLLKQKAEEYTKQLKASKEIDLRFLSFSKASISQISSILRLKDKDVVELIFSKEKVFGPYEMLNGYGVIVVENREQSIPKDRDAIIKEVLSLKSESVIDRYIDYLRKNSKISINKELLGIE